MSKVGYTKYDANLASGQTQPITVDTALIATVEQMVTQVGGLKTVITMQMGKVIVVEDDYTKVVTDWQ